MGKGGRCVRLTTYHHTVPLSRNLGTLTSWNPLGLSRPVMGLIYLFLSTWLDLIASPNNNFTENRQLGPYYIAAKNKTCYKGKCVKIWRHESIWWSGGIGGRNPLILKLGAAWGEWPASLCCPFTSEERAPGVQRRGALVDPRAGLDAFEKG